MKVFLSYASEDRAAARAIQLALAAQGHRVFFDREDLPPGEEYHVRIRRAIERADLFVFLITPEALDAGSYTLTELQIAEAHWRHPAGRILPVVLRATPFADLPVLLRSVTVLEPDGNVPASVAHAVHRLARARRRARLVRLGAPLLVALIAAAAWLLVRRDADDAAMALVPAGAFTMGDDEDSPLRDVRLDAFRLDRHEVTVALYRSFLEATGSLTVPDGWDAVDQAAHADLPVVGVDWHDAAAFCAWAGKRLPTEAEWEKAARGADARRYPWGDAPPDSTRANFLGDAPGAYAGGLRPVGARPDGRSPFGIHDLAGNAAEWVADWYADSFRAGDVRNPQGPADGAGRVIRGGGWMDPPDRITATRRLHASPDSRYDDTGFRCARDAG